MSGMAFFNMLDALIRNYDLICGNLRRNTLINIDVNFSDELHVAFTARLFVWLYYTRFRHLCNPRRMVPSGITKTYASYTYHTLGKLILETARNKSVDYIYNKPNQLRLAGGREGTHIAKQKISANHQSV